MTLASNRLVFLLHLFSPFHNFLASLLIDSNRVPIQAMATNTGDPGLNSDGIPTLSTKPPTLAPTLQKLAPIEPRD
jgi:hypothetical protein